MSRKFSSSPFFSPKPVTSLVPYFGFNPSIHTGFSKTLIPQCCCLYPDWGDVPQHIPKVAYTPVNKGPEISSVARVGIAEVEEEEEEEEWEYEEESEVYLRSKFFESWLWTSVTLPNTPEGDG